MSLVKPNHQLIRRISQGWYGEVYLGEDLVHGQVAVKVIRQTQGEPDVVWNLRKASLLQEGQRLHDAAHPNVVRVHYLAESEGEDAVHLVMEYCPGGSLQAAFETGPLQLAIVRKYATEVCRGLEALHAREMLHRDIKPGNILLTGANVAQIGDFELVTDNLILGYGSDAGYLDHLAIEVFQTGITSIRTDIWALGMTLYRLLHGAVWHSQLPADLKDAITAGGFASKLPWLPHIPDDFRRLIRKMMHDDSHARYQSAHEVMNALASLTVEPNWSCAVAPNEIRWTVQAGARVKFVVWTIYSPRRIARGSSIFPTKSRLEIFLAPNFFAANARWERLLVREHCSVVAGVCLCFGRGYMAFCLVFHVEHIVNI